MKESLFLPAVAIAIFTAVTIYGFGFLNGEISKWRSFWKTLPVAIMTLLRSHIWRWLAADIGARAQRRGDYFLSREKDKFTIGLVSFLTTHLLYI